MLKEYRHEITCKDCGETSTHTPGVGHDDFPKDREYYCEKCAKNVKDKTDKLITVDLDDQLKVKTITETILDKQVVEITR